MVSQSKDPVTGAPVFLATAAPDLGVDETEVAAYAGDVGNRIVRANLAGLNAYGYKRQGLMGHALDTKREYVHDGTGFVPLDGGTVIDLTAFSANWSQQGGYTSFLIAKGNTRFLYGVAARGAGGLLSSILTVPVGHRPSAAVFLPGNVTSGGSAYALQIQSNGILWVPYGGGSSAGAYPLAGSWEVA